MRSRVKHSKAVDWDCELLEVLVSRVTERAFVLYHLSDGPLVDPATTIERRCAIFRSQECSINDEEGLRKQIAKGKEKGGYWYDGLPGAISDEPFEAQQEGDSSANDHREQQKDMLTESTGYRSWDHNAKKEKYEAFLEAIDTLAEDYEDEAAWAAIEEWRQQHVLQYER